MKNTHISYPLLPYHGRRCQCYIAIVVNVIATLLLFVNCYLLLLSTICPTFSQRQILQAVDRAAPEVINQVGEENQSSWTPAVGEEM